MKSKKVKLNRESDLTRFENALKKKNRLKTFELQLFVTEGASQSTRAIINIKKICDEHLEGRCKLEIIDIRKNPEKVRKNQIVAAPTLLKSIPPPIRRLLGDLSNTERVLFLLNIHPEKDKKS